MGYSVVLAVIEGSTKYLIDYIDDGRIFEHKAQILADDIYRAATGKAILANLDYEKVQDIFKKYGPPSSDEWPEISSFDDLVAFIAQAKKDTVFKSRILHNVSQTINLGYGTAIFNKTGCIGAIGIAVHIPTAQEPDFKNEEKKIEKLLGRCAKELNRRLSFT